MAVIIVALTLVAIFLIAAGRIVFSAEYIEVVQQGISFLLAAIADAQDRVVIFLSEIRQ